MTDSVIAGAALQDLVLTVQAVASGAMCGVIWFVQVVHYPLFATLDGGRSRGYAVENQRRTGRVVVPLMALELATALAIAARPPAGVGRNAALAGLALVAVAWASTFRVQVPLHARLAAEGHDPGAVAALVRTNWIRTAAWTARALLAAWMLRAAVTP